jgi:hypothetical protein
MNRKAVRRFASLVAVLLLAPPLAAPADDSAASIAAGGLVPRRETRIVMAKEVLRIGTKKIVVDYDFRNDTDEDVTTEVAFPVPPYDHSETSYVVSIASFPDFLLSIDGKPAPFKAEAKATLKGKDVTGILESDRIDIASFGHLQEHEGLDTRNKIPDFTRLTEKEQKRLTASGLFDIDRYTAEANWTVHLQYHWTQTFPAHSTIHIRHEYAPALGFTQISWSDAEDELSNISASHAVKRNMEGTELLHGFCADRPFLDALYRPLRESALRATNPDEKLMAGLAYPHWVDFILTTANTWQRPIEDFTLIVERPRPDQNGRTLISFCSPQDAKAEKLDADHFQVHLTNFIPAAELHIGFFDIPAPNAAQPQATK